MTASDSTRTRCRCWTNRCSFRPSRTIGSRVDTLLELGRARIGAGNLPAAEAPLQEALHASLNAMPAPRASQTGHALWSLGMLAI